MGNQPILDWLECFRKRSLDRPYIIWSYIRDGLRSYFYGVVSHVYHASKSSRDMQAMLNYLSDSYLTGSASAQSIASTCRSLFGILLPFSARRMYSALGVHWACTLLGFLSLGVAIIPFAFIKYGERLRAGSKIRAELHMLRQMEEQEAAEENGAQTPQTPEELAKMA